MKGPGIRNWRRRLVGAQAAYYLATGIWPIADARSFQMVTGPKTDVWLVKTFGALVGAVGISLGLAAARNRTGPETLALAGGSAAALAAADIYYVSKGTIAKTYLGDAAINLGLLAGILLPSRPARRT
jgi:hypothetical protein